MKRVLWGRWVRRTKTEEGERGSVSIITSLSMMVFLICAGYAIDISHLYLAGTELQNAADAAAIAGASELNGFATGITSAVNAALATTNRYEFGKEVATFTREDVKFAVNLSDFNNGGGYGEAGAQGIADRIRFVNVLIRDKQISVPFINSVMTSNVAAVNVVNRSGAGPQGGASPLAQQASSTLSAGLNALCNSLMPLAVAQKMAGSLHSLNVAIHQRLSPSFASFLALNASTPSGTVSLSRQAVSGFSAGLDVLCDSIVPLSVVQDDETHAPLDVNAECSNKWEFTPGCKYIVRRGSNGNGNGGISPGNYLILALSGRGGSDARDGLAGGASGCFKPGDVVETKPGISAGPVRQGLNTRFGDYSSGLSATTYPPDLNVREDITYAQYRSGLAAYQQSPDNPGRGGRRIIIIPVVNKSEYNNGRDTVKIHKFAAFFLRNRVDGGNGGDIWAEFITMKVQVSDGYISGGSGDTQFSIPVLYR